MLEYAAYFIERAPIVFLAGKVERSVRDPKAAIRQFTAYSMRHECYERINIKPMAAPHKSPVNKVPSAAEPCRAVPR